MLNTIVDLYHGDNVVSWRDAIHKGGLVAVIHKATQGILSTDREYSQRRAYATKGGLLWGAYHFATGQDGTQQADHFLDIAQPDKQTLMALDLERNPSGPMVTRTQAHDFIARIHAKTGRFPYVYGSDVVAEFAGSHGDPVLSQCPLWIARYGHAPVVPPGWTQWTLWQYQAGEEGGDPLPGLGLVDRSQFNGDLEALRKVWAA